MAILLAVCAFLVIIASGFFAWRATRASLRDGLRPSEESSSWGEHTAAKVAVFVIPFVIVIWFIAKAPGGSVGWLIMRVLLVIAFILLAQVVRAQQSK